MAKIGIILSGGGVRGFAHLGLLQALDEWGILPDAISGVSAGAIIGALYAAGNKPENILAFMKGNSYFGWSNFIFKGDGFFSMKPMADALKKQIPEDSFESLQIKLFVTATDFTKNEEVVFSEGELFRAVIASASVPVIFEPVRFGSSLLIDGGVLNNFPVEPLQNICNKLIGCYVNKIDEIKEPSVKIGKTSILERCFNMASAVGAYSKKMLCDVFIEPSLDQFGMFDNDKADMIYEIGYKTAKEKKRDLISLCE
jgi:NTE family protein